MPQKQCGGIKTYNSNIEQLGVCLVKLKHKDKVATCRFFVVQGDDLALLGMPNIEFLDIPKITCEVVDNKQVGRKFDSQIIEPTGTVNSRAHAGNNSRSHSIGGINNNPNISDSGVSA